MRHLNRNDKFSQRQQIQCYQEAQSRVIDFHRLMTELVQVDLAISKQVKSFFNRSIKKTPASKDGFSDIKH